MKRWSNPIGLTLDNDYGRHDDDDKDCSDSSINADKFDALTYFLVGKIAGAKV